MTDQPRRFPAPWTVEEYRGISYIVRDANNFAVAYIYFEAEPGRRAAAQLMTKDEARKMRTASPNFLICSAPLSEKTATRSSREQTVQRAGSQARNAPKLLISRRETEAGDISARRRW
jgi:hypothetical protein